MAAKTKGADLSGVRDISFEERERSVTTSGGQGSEMVADGQGVAFLNMSGIDSGQLMGAMGEQFPELAALVNWTSGIQRRSSGGIFERDRFVTPTKIFDQMRAAQYAVEYDDVCAGVLESSEALAFGKMSVECWDEDEEDIWNQIADDIDLDTRMREMWRELFSVSQFYAFTWFGRKSYKVRGKTKQGIARKKQFSNLYVPLGISMLDPLRVVPVGNLLFNQDQLAYIGNRQDAQRIQPIVDGIGEDPVIRNMFLGKYEPDLDERRQLAAEGVDTSYLYLLNPLTVWRHSDTRPQYQRFASVRMKSVFELLDLKQQLREMDRATLLGSTNFLVLVKKGSKEEPANQQEIANLQANMRTMARVPFIFGDHRLEIEIITPKNDNTLKPERYASLNGQISARLFQMFVAGNANAGRSDDSIKMARVIARGLESRRQQLKRQVERKVFDPVYKVNGDLTSEPSLQFHPKQIALDFDTGLANMLLDLRDRREISRATILSTLDLSEADEARKREREKEHFDDIFETLTGLQDPKLAHELQLDTLEHEQLVPKATGVPAAKGTPTATNPSGARGAPVKKKSAPADTKSGGGGDPKGAGRTRGGNRKGGGAAPGTGQGQEADPRRGAKNATKKAA